MINRPDGLELVTAVREMLEEQLVPALEEKSLIYQSRVSINILKIVEREMSLAGTMAQSEQHRLTNLLNEQGSLEALNASLVKRIRAGELNQCSHELMDHLLSTTLDKLAIDNPAYSTYLEYQEFGQFRNH